MKRTYSLITCLVILALVAGATVARAQRQTPEGDIEAQAAAATDITFAHFFLQDPTTSTAWYHSHTVVDGSGGVHLVFNDIDNIYYAHCALNCSNPANWLELPLFAAGTYDSMNEPTLGVDASGRPRLMWFTEYSGDTNSYYYYAECNANCTDSAANWASVAVVDPGSYGYPHNVRYFALDAQGRPRMVYEMTNYPDHGFNYLTCDAGCTTASHWHTTAVTTPDLQPNEILQLVFDQNSRPRVLGYDFDNSVLVYAECNSDCSTAANWGSVALFDVGYYFDYDFALRLDAGGHPRIAYYLKDSNNNVLLYYAWSNANSLTVTGWSSYSLNYPKKYELSLDLALDSQGRPRIVYDTDELDLSYLACTANCETASPTWQQQYIETGDDLNASDPIAQIPTCSPPTWMVVGYPSLALDAADNPHVSYYVKHGQSCEYPPGHYEIYYNARGIRFARPGGTAPNGLRIYLPLVIR